MLLANSMTRQLIALGILLLGCACLGCATEQPAVELTTAELITCTTEGDVLRVTISETESRVSGVFKQSGAAYHKYGSRFFSAPYEPQYLEQLQGVFTKFGVEYEVVE